MNISILKKIKLIGLIMGLMLISGCMAASGRFANLRHDDQVKQAFENLTVIPGYQYYYFGSDTFPRAFVGISKGFTVDSTLWKPIELTPDILHRWIRFQANVKPGNLQRYGSNMTGPRGEHIGVWYSLEGWSQWARIELVDKTVVKIGTPVMDRHYGRFSYTRASLNPL